MPYSDRDHDRALSRLHQDLDGFDPPRRIEAGIGLCFALLALILGLCVLLSAGCNTLAGVGQDLHDLAEGTRQQLTEEPREPRY